mgnify:CR=1 FL=1
MGAAASVDLRKWLIGAIARAHTAGVGTLLTIGTKLREFDKVRAIAEGNSVMMFPEGTRSPDGRLKAFKHGAFTIAQRARVPLLPIVLQGTANALPKRGFVLQGRHQIRIRVLDEIPPETFAHKPVEALMQEVRDRIATELNQPAAA